MFLVGLDVKPAKAYLRLQRCGELNFSPVSDHAAYGVTMLNFTLPNISAQKHKKKKKKHCYCFSLEFEPNQHHLAEWLQYYYCQVKLLCPSSTPVCEGFYLLSNVCL